MRQRQGASYNKPQNFSQQNEAKSMRKIQGESRIPAFLTMMNHQD